MERPPVGKVEDLATLAKLDEKVLLSELKTRYYNNEIYVSRSRSTRIIVIIIM